MTSKFEKKGIKLKRQKDRRVKLTHEQREEIRANEKGLSQRSLAKEYNVSRRLIQFILDPLKHEENKKRREERGGTMKYYDKEKHKQSMRDYRKHKKKMHEEGHIYED